MPIDGKAIRNMVEYTAWKDIKRRCYNKNNKFYSMYGGRGITMCPTWASSFLAFYKDMGPRPEGHSIDRIDNNGSYTKSNCRWATPLQQAYNRTTTKLITYNGLTKPVTIWMQELNNPLIALRIRRGWSVEKAITTPIQHRRKSCQEQKI